MSRSIAAFAGTSSLNGHSSGCHRQISLTRGRVSAVEHKRLTTSQANHTPGRIKLFRASNELFSARSGQNYINSAKKLLQRLRKPINIIALLSMTNSCFERFFNKKGDDNGLNRMAQPCRVGIYINSSALSLHKSRPGFWNLCFSVNGQVFFLRGRKIAAGCKRRFGVGGG